MAKMKRKKKKQQILL